MRSYNVMENHIISAVSEILRYRQTQTNPVTLLYKFTYLSTYILPETEQTVCMLVAVDWASLWSWSRFLEVSTVLLEVLDRRKP